MIDPEALQRREAAMAKAGPEDSSLWEAFSQGDLLAWEFLADDDYMSRMVRTRDDRYIVVLLRSIRVWFHPLKLVRKSLTRNSSIRSPTGTATFGI